MKIVQSLLLLNLILLNNFKLVVFSLVLLLVQDKVAVLMVTFWKEKNLNSIFVRSVSRKPNKLALFFMFVVFGIFN